MNGTTTDTDITDTLYITSSVYLATVGGLGIALNAKALAKLLKVTKVKVYYFDRYKNVKLN